MKKLPYITSAVGLVIFGTAGSCDFVENPIIAIPLVIGVFLVFAGFYMERSWNFEAKEDFECDDCFYDDSNDGVTYISCESAGSPRDLDFK